MSHCASVDLKMVFTYIYDTYTHTHTVRVIGVFDGRPISVKRHRRLLYFITMRLKLLN